MSDHQRQADTIIKIGLIVVGVLAALPALRDWLDPPDRSWTAEDQARFDQRMENLERQIHFTERRYLGD